jgi:hypothetical protein
LSNHEKGVIVKKSISKPARLFSFATVLLLVLSACSTGPSVAEKLLVEAKSKVQLVGGSQRELTVSDENSSMGTCNAASLHVKLMHEPKSAYLSEASTNLVNIIKVIRSSEEFNGFGLYYNAVLVNLVTDKFGNENVSQETSLIDVCFTSYDIQQINLSNTDYLNQHVLEMASYDIKKMLGL